MKISNIKWNKTSKISPAMSAQISMCVCLYIYILLDYFPYGTYDMRTHTFRCETVTSADAHSLWSGPFHHKIWKTNPDNKVHGAHLGPVDPRWAPCWPHEFCYQGMLFSTSLSFLNGYVYTLLGEKVVAPGMRYFLVIIHIRSAFEVSRLVGRICSFSLYCIYNFV